MKNYKLLADIWIKGIEKKAGEVVSMIDAEAKYLKHALEEVVADAKKVAAAVAPKAPAAPAAPAPVAGASVQEVKSAQ